MATIWFFLLSLYSIFLFLVLFPEMITSTRESCPSIQCSSTEPKISYPFGIKDFESVQCGNGYKPGYNLTCNSKGETVIDNIPFLDGKFLVRKINYHRREIQIQDPDNCLPRRYLRDLNDAYDSATSTSLLKAYAYQLHTFFSCTTSSMAININRYSTYFRTVSCLSSLTHSVLVTVSTSDSFKLDINKILIDSGYCEVIDHIFVPIRKTLYGTVYDLTKDNLYLSWGATPPLRRNSKENIIIGAICGGVGVLIIVLVLVCCCKNRKVWNMTVDLILLGLNVVANLHGCGCCFTVFMRCIKRKGPNLHGIDQAMQ
ncbi:hypothetical protein MKX01_027946 [Papaver californicum]|nr:hypothetical protein MKX01_027946 [Papaver californicum]